MGFCLSQITFLYRQQAPSIVTYRLVLRQAFAPTEGRAIAIESTVGSNTSCRGDPFPDRSLVDVVIIYRYGIIASKTSKTTVESQRGATAGAIA